MFEELDYRSTAMGALSLRRRRRPGGDTEVYEVKLGDEFLMSSLFTEAERELARLGLEAAGAPGGKLESPLDVVVGGLGLGYTAAEVLRCEAVRSLVVVEALAEVVEWHRSGLLPLGPGLAGDPRCRLHVGDFFALAGSGFDPEEPGRRFHAVLLDIDHAPDRLLSPAHAAFYSRDGLDRLKRHLQPGGVFGLWSDDPPDDRFLGLLGEVFAEAEARVVAFDNPVRGGQSTNTVYLARTAPA